MSNKVYDIVKEKILTKLEEAEKTGEKFNWVKPWNGGPNYPISYSSARPYKGINAVLLDAGQEYITFKQIQQLQATNPEIKLKKGSKSEQVFFYTQAEKKDEQGNPVLNENNQPQTFSVLKYYNVFNIRDVEGLNPRFQIKTYEHTPDENMVKAEKYIEEFCNRSKLKFNVEKGSNRAFYSLNQHSVSLPDKSQFESQYEYFSTVFHELAHSTGKELGRDMKNGFGSEKYSKEELVAEIASQMLCNTFGIIDDRTENNSVAYIQSWSSHLKEEKPTLIASACINAQKACDLIAQEYLKELSLSEQPIEVTEQKQSLNDKINAAETVKESKSETAPVEKPIKQNKKAKAKDDAIAV